MEHLPRWACLLIECGAVAAAAAFVLSLISGWPY